MIGGPCTVVDWSTIPTADRNMCPDAIGRHAGAGPQDHDIPDDKLRCGNLQHRAIGLPAERRFGTKRHQRLDGAARTAERLVLKRRRHA